MSADGYRAKHGLPAGFTLRTVPREGGDPDNLWVRRLKAAGFATWEEALIDLAKKHRNLKDLGDWMGVAGNVVTNALLRSRPVDTWARPSRTASDGTATSKTTAYVRDATSAVSGSSGSVATPRFIPLPMARL